jgi:hypothetical protein
MTTYYEKGIEGLRYCLMVVILENYWLISDHVSDRN